MWIEGTQFCKKENYNDINELFIKKLEGKNLEDEEARSTLAQFLRYNIGLAIYLLTGIQLKPYQIVTLRGWMNKNFSMAVWGRANGKSFTAQIFIILYALFNPGAKILVVSQNFRSSRRILENIEKIALSPKGALLADTFAKPMQKRPDIYTLTFSNGAEASCVPLSNGEGLRGLRANVLIIDEGLLVPEQIIENVLKPFLGAKSNITDSDEIRDAENMLVSKGLMNENERTNFDVPTNKMIILSSASYTWEYLYKMYSQYIETACNAERNKANKISNATYFVSKLSYEIIPPEILDKAVLDDIKNGNMSEDTIDREYRAKFTDNSSGYFKADKLKECVLEVGQYPTVEIYGDSKSEYIIAIDPSLSGSEASDHFAMYVLKIIENEAGKKIGVMVHGYAESGGLLNDHIEYFKYLYLAFNPVYIIVDTTQGDRGDFISVCNESQIFKQANIFLDTIQADFSREDMTELPKQIKRSYSKEMKRIVQKQTFANTSFIKGANERLQGCIENKVILFASNCSMCEEAYVVTKNKGPLPEIVTKHKNFIKRDINDYLGFIEHQDYVIDLIIREMVLIVVKASPTGVLQYDLPIELKRIRGANRPRRDSYTATMLASWAMKLYLESKDLPADNNFDTFEPIVV